MTFCSERTATTWRTPIAAKTSAAGCEWHAETKTSFVCCSRPRASEAPGRHAVRAREEAPRGRRPAERGLGVGARWKGVRSRCSESWSSAPSVSSKPKKKASFSGTTLLSRIFSGLCFGDQRLRERGAARELHMNFVTNFPTTHILQGPPRRRRRATTARRPRPTLTSTSRMWSRSRRASCPRGSPQCTSSSVR